MHISEFGAKVIFAQKSRFFQVVFIRSPRPHWVQIWHQNIEIPTFAKKCSRGAKYKVVNFEGIDLYNNCRLKLSTKKHICGQHHHLYPVVGPREGSKHKNVYTFCFRIDRKKFVGQNLCYREAFQKNIKNQKYFFCRQLY